MRHAHATVRLRAMFLLADEVAAAAEAFAQKFDDVRRRHRVLWGRDPFATLAPSRAALVGRVNQVLLNLALRLRAAYVERSPREEQLVAVVADAAAPLRTAAASLLDLEGRRAPSPKAALREVAQGMGGRADRGRADPHEPGPERPARCRPASPGRSCSSWLRWRARCERGCAPWAEACATRSTSPAPTSSSSTAPCSRHARAALRRPGGRRLGSAPRIDTGDAYFIAYLRGGKPEALRVATIALIDRGCSCTPPRATRTVLAPAQLTKPQHPLELAPWATSSSHTWRGPFSVATSSPPSARLRAPPRGPGPGARRRATLGPSPPPGGGAGGAHRDVGGQDRRRAARGGATCSSSSC